MREISLIGNGDSVAHFILNEKLTNIQALVGSHRTGRLITSLYQSAFNLVENDVRVIIHDGDRKYILRAKLVNLLFACNSEKDGRPCAEYQAVLEISR